MPDKKQADSRDGCRAGKRIAAFASYLSNAETGTCSPVEWVVARTCEEYHCTPSVACRELGLRPLAPWITTFIMELRALADIHRRHTSSKPDTEDIGRDYGDLYADYLLAVTGMYKD